MQHNILDGQDKTLHRHDQGRAFLQAGNGHSTRLVVIAMHRNHQIEQRFIHKYVLELSCG